MVCFNNWKHTHAHLHCIVGFLTQFNLYKHKGKKGGIDIDEHKKKKGKKNDEMNKEK